MLEKKEYAVVRFFQQGGKCYKIDDVTEGSNLLQIMKGEEEISKRELFAWFASLWEQLNYYHKCVNRGYGYVNPYAVIINEEGKVSLLDIDSKENNELLKRMQKKNFRTLFVREGENTGQNSKPGDDYFGFGKLLLFMMEKGKFKTHFSKYERIKLNRLIEKCIHNEKRDKLILERIPEELMRMSGRGVWKGWNMKIIMAGFIVIGGLGITIGLNHQSIRKANGVSQIEVKESAEADSKVLYDEAEGERLSLELSMLYYTELGDVVAAREMLSQVKGESKITEIYLQILDYIQTGNNLDEDRWYEIWQELKGEWERLGVQNKLWYKMPVLEACRLRNTKESWSIVCEIGENIRENRTWNGMEEHPEKETSILNYLREAYEAVGDNAKLEEVNGVLTSIGNNTEQSRKQFEEEDKDLQEVMEETTKEDTSEVTEK